MEQKEQLQHLSADELWLMREDVDLKLATILLKRKSMLEERLERLQVQSRVALNRCYSNLGTTRAR
jgi:hypothetical protein